MKIKKGVYVFIRPIVIKYLEYFGNFNIFDRVRLKLIHVFYSNYHPIDILSDENNSKRNVLDRYQSIRSNIEGVNCLDIGCQSGFFSLRLANEGYWVTGLDRDNIILDKANLVKKKFSIDNASFVKYSIDTTSVSLLQNFDNILYLSIHHHMIKVHGFQKATEILRELCKKTNYKLFFDFPYPDAYANNELFSEIPDMGSDPDSWIKDYLLSVGFREVHSIGVFSHNLKKYEKRNLFMAVK